MAKRTSIVAMVVAIVVAFLTISCSNSKSIYGGSDTPAQEVIPTYYNPTDASHVEIYDGSKNLMEKNVSWSGWQLKADSVKNHSANTAVVFEDQFLTVSKDGVYYVEYTVGGQPYTYKVNFQGYEFLYSGNKVRPLHDIELDIHGVRDEAACSSKPFFDRFVCTNTLTYKNTDKMSAKTVINVSEPDKERIPVNVTVIDDETVRINFNDNSSEVANASFSLNAGGDYKLTGTKGISTGNLSKEAAAQLYFNYTYGDGNSVADAVTVEGIASYSYEYNDKVYELPFTNKFSVVGDWTVLENGKDGFDFYEKSKTVYTLLADEIDLSSDSSIFVVKQASEEKAPEPENVTVIDDETVRINFDDGSSKEAKASFSLNAGGDYKLTGTKGISAGNLSKNAVTEMFFNYTYGDGNSVADAVTVDGITSYSYKHNGKVYELPFTNKFSVVGDWTVLENGKDGFDFYEKSKTVYTLVADNKIDLSSDSSIFVVKQTTTATPASPKYWKQVNGNAVITFDDGSTVIVANPLSMTAESRYEKEGTVAVTSSNLSKTAANTNVFAYNYSINNTVSVNGNVGKAIDYKEWKNIPCQSDFVIKGVMSTDVNGKNGYDFYWLGHTTYTLYADGKAITAATQDFLVSKKTEVVPASPKYWKQVNGNAVITFDDGSTVTVANPLSMTAESRYEKEGTVAVTSSNLSKTAANTNVFAYNYSINNTVSVSGNVGKGIDYKEWKNIPCQSDFVIKGVMGTTTNGKTGYQFYWLGYTTYTLYADNVAVATAKQEFLVSKAKANVPVIPGNVVSLIATDHYNGRTLAGTAVHARLSDGTVYSFEIGSDVNSGSKTKTSVTGTYAWYGTNGNWTLGTVKAEKVDSPATDYVLTYWSLDGQLASALGNAEATLNGSGFRHPVHTVTYDQTNNIWTIKVGNSTYQYTDKSN